MMGSSMSEPVGSKPATSVASFASTDFPPLGKFDTRATAPLQRGFFVAKGGRAWLSIKLACIILLRLRESSLVL